MAFVSFAQNAEDVLLYRALGHIDFGHYIDIGANHPIEDSVTKAFYDRGWRGINIEPVGFWFKQLQTDRIRDQNLQIAISDTNDSLQFFEVEETGLSTLDPDRAKLSQEQGYQVVSSTIDCWTLVRLFSEIGSIEVHFLKIDVEGAEGQVIHSGDWRKFRPWIVLVESTRPNTNESEHHDWEPTLLDAGYGFVWFDGINRYYLAEEHSNLSVHFGIPINVLDNYVTFREVALTESRYQLILDMEWRQEDFRLELQSAKAAIASSKTAHDNARQAFEEQSKILVSQSALINWYQNDFIIKTAIRFRKLPGIFKRHLIHRIRQTLNRMIQYLDENPQIKVKLISYLKRFPRLVKSLQTLTGRPFPRLSQCRATKRAPSQETKNDAERDQPIQKRSDEHD